MARPRQATPEAAPQDWKSQVVRAWSQERRQPVGVLGLLPPTDDELHRLLEMAEAVVAERTLSRPCPQCRFAGKACGFCRRVTPGSKPVAGEGS